MKYLAMGIRTMRNFLEILMIIGGLKFLIKKLQEPPIWMQSNRNFALFMLRQVANFTHMMLGCQSGVFLIFLIFRL